MHVHPADNMKEVKHLLDIPGAKSKLSLWKANLSEEGSFDEAIKGCIGVFHLATPIDFESKDPEVFFWIFSNLLRQRLIPWNKSKDIKGYAILFHYLHSFCKH